MTSAGFAGRRVGTSHSISATALAGTGTDMQRDYDYHSTVYFGDLDDPEKIGRSAGERAIARLNPARPKTARIPVVYDPRVAGSLLGHLAGAINGAGVACGVRASRINTNATREIPSVAKKASKNVKRNFIVTFQRAVYRVLFLSTSRRCRQRGDNHTCTPPYSW